MKIRLTEAEDRALRSSKSAWTNPEFLTQVRDQATKFTLVAGETKTVDLPLSPPPVF